MLLDPKLTTRLCRVTNDLGITENPFVTLHDLLCVHLIGKEFMSQKAIDVQEIEKTIDRCGSLKHTCPDVKLNNLRLEIIRAFPDLIYTSDRNALAEGISLILYRMRRTKD